jgi:hypothetical protein
MAKKRKKKVSEQEMFIKAFRKANRELEMERNDGKWVATKRVWKNKKAYDRKRDRKFNTDYLFFYLTFTTRSFLRITLLANDKHSSIHF